MANRPGRNPTFQIWSTYVRLGLEMPAISGVAWIGASSGPRMQGTDVRSTLVHPQLELACAGVEEVMDPCASIHGDIELVMYTC